MRENALRRLTALVLPALLFAGIPSVKVEAQTDARTFAETGKTVQGRFLRYWDAHGGLSQQGFPVSGEMQERSQADGKLYAVQYFERAVFEYHPENAAPSDVLLSLLGTFAYREKYPDGAPGQGASTSNPRMFPETGKTLGGRFREYWERNGGLAQQGYPISEEFKETSALDGKVYTVQYFERAVFEYHPENEPPNDVLLSQLGKYRLDALTAGNAIYLRTLDAVWRDVRDSYIYTDFRGQDWAGVGRQYRERLVEATSEEEAYRLISAMIVGLDDRHSHFQDPALRKQAEDARRGRISLVGIGASLQEIEGGRRVSFVFPGGPAEKAGLRVYDTIRAIDGRSLIEDPEAVRLVRGPVGSSVRLLVESHGEAPREVTVARGEVQFEDKITARRLPGTSVVYVNIPTFLVEGIAGRVRDSLAKAIGSGPLDGVIVDVRLNSGGADDELIEAISMFVDGGVAGYQIRRDGRTATSVPTGRTPPQMRGKPVVVLVSGICESACEHFAVAMQDLKRATTLGTKTAGNTETTYPHNYEDGSRLLLAEEMFVRADGSSIEDVGFRPAVVMDVPWYRYSLDDDPQVKRAVEIIRGR